MDMQKPGPWRRSSSINRGPGAAVECKTLEVAQGGMLVNSIEHGGTGTFSNMWYFCWIFVLLYFGIFVWDFLWHGRFYMVPLTYDSGMVPR